MSQVREIVTRLLSRRQLVVAAATAIVAGATALGVLVRGQPWGLAVVIAFAAVIVVGILSVQHQIAKASQRAERILDRKVEAVRADLIAADARERTRALSRLSAIEGRLAASEKAAAAFRQELRQGLLQIGTDAWSIHNLTRLVPVDGEFPAPGGWAATPQTLLALVAHTQRRAGDMLVVECGSGTSTLWLAATMRQRGAGRVVAIEHEEEFAEATREHLRNNDLQDWAEVRCAPLAPTTIDGAEYLWYDTTTFADLGSIDVLLVDGPPWRTGEHARYPAVPTLIDHLAPGAVVVLDDVGRDAEREIARRWVGEEYDGRVLRRTRRLDRAQMFTVADVVDEGGPGQSTEEHSGADPEVSNGGGALRGNHDQTGSGGTAIDVSDGVRRVRTLAAQRAQRVPTPRGSAR